MELDATLDHIHEKQVFTFLKFDLHICPLPIFYLHFGYNPVTVLYVISISDVSNVQALLGHLDRKLGHLERQQHQLMDASLGVKVSSIWFYLKSFPVIICFQVFFLYQLLKTVGADMPAKAKKGVSEDVLKAFLTFRRRAWLCRVRHKQSWRKGWSRKLETSAATTQVHNEKKGPMQNLLHCPIYSTWILIC